MSEPNSPSDNLSTNQSDKTGADEIAPQADPWEPLEKETGKAYEAFQSFLLLPSSGRSILAAYNADRQRTGKEPAKQSSGNWNFWATIYRWQERARAYDEYMAGVERQEREAQRKREARDKEAKHLERIRDYREQLHDTNAASLSMSIRMMGIIARRLEIAEDNEEEIATIPLRQLASMINAAVAASASASSALAQSLAVNEILDKLDGSNEQQGEESSE